MKKYEFGKREVIQYNSVRCTFFERIYWTRHHVDGKATRMCIQFRKTKRLLNTKRREITPAFLI
jgi:hypothetical protein